MRICMLLGPEFPPDIRVRKECKTLIDAGYEVHLVCRNKSRRPVEERIDGIQIHRLHCLARVLGRLNAWITVPHFANPIWFAKLFCTVRKYGIDVLHVHDLPLMLTGIIVGRYYGIPVILDNHENYPELLKTVGHRGVILTTLFNSRIFKHIEKFCMKHVSAVICTADEAAEFYSSMGYPTKRFVTLINAVDLDLFSSPVVLPEVVDRYNGYFVVSYIGGIGVDRNLDLVIRAMSVLTKKNNDIHLLLVGRSEGNTVDRLKNLRDCLGISNYVTFTGEIPFSHVPTYISLSRILLACHTPSLHTHTTTPHKIFQYMALGKPVIVTNVRPLKRIVESEDCGIVVHRNDPKEMAEAILRLYQNPEYARKLGANGRRAVIQKYNWRKVSKRLVDLYETLGDQ